MWAIALKAAAAAEETKKGLPQLHAPDFEPQLIWLALAFLLLYLLLSRIALPRIGEVIEERRNRIERDLTTANALKQETEQALANYEQALAEARGRAHGIARETRDGLTQEIEREKQRIDGEMAAKMRAAEDAIAATKHRALASVETIAGETASAIIAKLLGEEPKSDEIAAAMRQAAAE